MAGIVVCGDYNCTYSQIIQYAILLCTLQSTLSKGQPLEHFCNKFSHCRNSLVKAQSNYYKLFLTALLYSLCTSCSLYRTAFYTGEKNFTMYHPERKHRQAIYLATNYCHLVSMKKSGDKGESMICALYVLQHAKVHLSNGLKELLE